MNNRFRSLIVGALVVFAVGAPALAKKVICIAGGNSPAISDKEGYERTQGIGPGDVVQIGGDLTTALGMVMNGDELVIIAHGGGNGATFSWGGTPYTGFGSGPGLMPTPPGFSGLMNVHIRFCTCFSTQGSPPSSSLVNKLINAMGGPGRGHVGSGFYGTGNVGVIPHVKGGDAGQRAQVREHLKNFPFWEGNPPANRPGTGGKGQPPNQQSAAQAQADQIFGAGVVTVTIPNQVGSTSGFSPVPGYLQPQDGGFVTARGDPICTCDGCDCTCIEVSIGGSEIPAMSEWGLGALGVMFVIVGAVVVRRVVGS